MPLDWKAELGNDRIPKKHWLKMPAIGMESEFNVFLDGVEIIPEDYWKHPSAFIDVPMLARTKKSSQLPTGGAVYFDRGVIEVVTPLIEIAPGCTARAVRSLWEQIEFVRAQLTNWERKTKHDVRLKAYSTHYNVSFELPRAEQNRERNAKRLALLLAYILPVPVMLAAANRRSTGIGVRPRGNRIEVTCDFTPDPGLMVAAATLITGIVRAVIAWPSYRLSLLRDLPIPTIAGVIPGKHTTRKGWLTKDFHYAQSPYTADIDAPIWPVRDGRTLSLRQIGFEVASFFSATIREHSDPFSYRLLFGILEGRAPSMLELKDRPAAYEDVGRLCRWGRVINELKSVRTEEAMMPSRSLIWHDRSIEEHIVDRELERRKRRAVVRPAMEKKGAPETSPAGSLPGPGLLRSVATRETRRSNLPSGRAGLARRYRDRSGALLPPRNEYLDRRSLAGRPLLEERRRAPDRRKRTAAVPFPDRRLTRSA
ncbi:MAG: hypothetical protein ACYC9N_11560, partial [Thermoanaerobaculia bacterium]